MIGYRHPIMRWIVVIAIVVGGWLYVADRVRESGKGPLEFFLSIFQMPEETDESVPDVTAPAGSGDAGGLGQNTPAQPAKWESLSESAAQTLQTLARPLGVGAVAPVDSVVMELRDAADASGISKVRRETLLRLAAGLEHLSARRQEAVRRLQAAAKAPQTALSPVTPRRAGSSLGESSGLSTGELGGGQPTVQRAASGDARDNFFSDSVERAWGEELRRNQPAMEALIDRLATLGD